MRATSRLNSVWTTSVGKLIRCDGDVEKELLPPSLTWRPSLGLPDRYLQPRGPHSGKIGIDLLLDPSFPLVREVNSSSPELRRPSPAKVRRSPPSGSRKVSPDRQEAYHHFARTFPRSRFRHQRRRRGRRPPQIEPSENINLHFTGDFHAISRAQSARCAPRRTSLPWQRAAISIPIESPGPAPWT